MTNNNTSNFENFRRQYLSKIHTYTDENQNTIYFYFFKGNRSEYFKVTQLKHLSEKMREHEKELINEYKQLKSQRILQAA